MDFKKKINIIFDFLGCRNIDIANISNLHASIISRFRTGARIPKNNSENLIQLCTAITTYANQHNRLEDLAKFCGIKDNIHNDIFYKSLQTWFMTSETDVSISHMPIISAPFCNFSQKLSSVMSLLNISNVTLAKAVNIDASLVSRFRNGSRKPSTKNSIAPNICSYLLEKAYKSSYLPDLCDLIGYPKKESMENKGLLLKHFFDWLSDKNELPEQNALLHLFNAFDNYSMDTAVKKNNLPSITQNIPRTDLTHEIHIGRTGLRDIAIHLLSSCYNSNNSNTLYLYSDFSFFWLFNTKEEKNQVFNLLKLLTEKKVTIYIIHTLERSFLELISLIEKWLPLYCTGYVKPFYHNRAYDGRFSHVLYIAENVGVISSTFVHSDTESTEHFYLTSEHKINYYINQFNLLLKSSSSFLKVHQLETVHSYLEIFSSTLYGSTPLDILQPTFAFHFINSELLDQVLYENNVNEYLKKLYIDCNAFTDFVMNIVTKCKLTIYTILIDSNLLPSSHELKFIDTNKLLNDPNYLMLEMNVYHSLKKKIYFSKETYLKYLDMLKDLEKKHPFNFKHITLSHSPFGSTYLLHKKGVCAYAHAFGSSSIILELNHPLLMQAIDKNLTNLREN